MRKNARPKLTAKELKAILKEKGYSVSGWCRTNGFVRGTVEYALTYKRNGKLSKKIRQKVESL